MQLVGNFLGGEGGGGMRNWKIKLKQIVTLIQSWECPSEKWKKRHSDYKIVLLKYFQHYVILAVQNSSSYTLICIILTICVKVPLDYSV